MKRKLGLLWANSWFIWFCGALFYLYQFILRVSPSVLQDFLMQDFAIDGCALGVLGACFYKAYVLMQIPVGLLIDRYGIRRLLAFFCLLASLGSIVFAYSVNLSWASIGRFFIGAGSACAFIGVVNLINVSFPKEKTARVVGLTILLGTIGATVGGAPLAYLAEIFGWRQSLKIIGIAGIILAVILFLVLYNNKYLKKIKDEHDLEKKPEVIKNLLIVVKSPQVWLLGIYGNLMYVPLAVMSDLWGTSFIVSGYLIDKKIAAITVSFIYIGAAIGALLVAYWSDKIKCRKKPMFICTCCAIIFYSFIIYGNIQSLYILTFFMFLGGMCFWGQCLVFSMISRVVLIGIQN